MKEEPRLGVFVCHCGVNIGGVVKVPEVVEYAKTLPQVTYAEDNIYTCSEAGLDSIKDAIKKYNLNRVIVASCTPRTHEPLFRSACNEAGLNPYLFEMANIREQCSWVHPKEPQKATEKAKDVVRMAVARAAWLEPQIEPEVEIKDSALVIGAGMAGLTSALTLANQGFKVHLVEKEDKIGGNVRRLYKLYPTMEEAEKILEPVVEAVKKQKNIELLTSATVGEVGGYVGNFNVTVNRKGEKIPLNVGTIIVACGALNYQPPTGLYQYGVHDNVITQLELDEMLREGKLGKPERVVMIQCVGGRKGEIRGYELESFPKSDTAKLLRKVLKAKKEEGWPYCSRICCMNAIKNAILIKTVSPKTDVIILYSDLRVYKEYEDFYSRSRDLEVKFIKFLEIVTPEISETPDKKLKVLAYDMLAGREAEFVADYVVLSTPLIPHKDEVTLARMLKIPISPDGFLMEAHLKLRPVDTAMDGIYLAGSASGPKDVPETIISAKAAAARAAILMANKKMRTEAITAMVDEDLCIGCGLCEELCPFGAPRIEESKSKLIEALCRGCGVCAAECPRRAITMRHYSDQQVLAQVEAALVLEGFEKRGA
ncbi:MAG: CoB--CoM heterodisulfide reductase iron-sulfur subunit A family protein [Candidatus Bathyarchaeota archaeon]|nr:CoB--CoM heterodisulfide reductase iron-sulfur subunit A family protein [Candidatus Bathyarchaeota archaeon]MDH5418833.1 CoB--CoM heterodisulfide reductase iron-sulfur subunit A family protein [Candidatus Bathyarchaeota archaeon]MDH5635091.1 CoB--CoM heterodisulfide reductase iron-sulfur subunit A family protein [Candidatus Bathyarchaeota archaeon]MDH5701513.1 CoB--CoM heterodisulfide reductase iron-sulfur subunit A family protein [Candidatus Bathyarchaeota archaeon]